MSAKTSSMRRGKRLNANDPNTALSMLERAFADNEAPAAAVECAGDRITILMLAPGPDVVPERQPAFTPSGNPTLKKRTKAELSDMYVAIVASHVLATAKEAFAVAPAIQRAVVVVLQKVTSAGLGPDRVDAIFCGTFDRDLLTRVDWSGIDPVRVLDEVPDALIRRKGRAGELQPLDLADEPDLESIVDSVERGLQEAA